jgi:hypothetical protein
MDKTGIILIILNSVNFRVGKKDVRGYKGTRVKRTMVTTIVCISGDGRCLNPMVIWHASATRLRIGDTNCC